MPLVCCVVESYYFETFFETIFDQIFLTHYFLFLCRVYSIERVVDILFAFALISADSSAGNSAFE